MDQQDKQTAQDMLQAALNQRNSALNECIQLAAQVMALERKVAELEKAKEEPAPARASNGHDAEARAPA